MLESRVWLSKSFMQKEARLGFVARRLLLSPKNCARERFRCEAEEGLSIHGQRNIDGRKFSGPFFLQLDDSNGNGRVWTRNGQCQRGHPHHT